MAGERALCSTGRSVSLRKCAWTAEEDDLLRDCVTKHGEGKWHLIPETAGLRHCRKSCRLRWLNYLKPKIKRGEFQDDEVDLILRLHRLLGNRWSLIAGRIPGRTANDIKNYWNTSSGKKNVRRREQEVQSYERKFGKHRRPRRRPSCAAAPAFSSVSSPANDAGSSRRTRRGDQAPSMAPLDVAAAPGPATADGCPSWWKDLLEEDETTMAEEENKRLEEYMISFRDVINIRPT